MAEQKDIIIVFKTNGLGMTEVQPLKEKLAITYLTLAQQMEPPPAAICFYTDGVRLACEGSPVLEELKALEAKGIRLILCQTCLNAFELSDKVKVGTVGGMADIITAMWQANSVITV
ncbi:MAG: DsrE family protein [Anaerolineales bacterium]|jgi:intracellular sulfur oxidation DsrE/DsrF family protein